MLTIATPWRRLTEAPAKIVDPVLRQKIRLLSGLLLLVIPLGFMTVYLRLLSDPDFLPAFQAAMGALGVLGVAFGMVRGGYYQSAAILTI